MTKKSLAKKYGGSRKQKRGATVPAIPRPTVTAAADFTRAMMGAGRPASCPSPA